MSAKYYSRSRTPRNIIREVSVREMLFAEWDSANYYSRSRPCGLGVALRLVVALAHGMLCDWSVGRQACLGLVGNVCGGLLQLWKKGSFAGELPPLDTWCIDGSDDWIILTV